MNGMLSELQNEKNELDIDTIWQKAYLDSLMKQKVERLKEENTREQRNIEKQFTDITEDDIKQMVSYCSNEDNVKKEFSYREGLRLMKIGAYKDNQELKSIGHDFVKKCENRK